MNERRRLRSQTHGERETVVFDDPTAKSWISQENDHSLFNKKSLESMSKGLKQVYPAALPFSHFSIKNLVPWQLATCVHRDFPTYKELNYERPSGESNNVFTFTNCARMPHSIQRVYKELCHPVFLNFLEESTQIQGLIPDPYLEGAGLEYCLRGGEIEFAKPTQQHPKLKLYRRLKIIISVNMDWQESWGGDIEFQDSELKFSPQFNDVICFDAMNAPPHGCSALKCPRGFARKSLLAYFYTANKN